MPLHTKHKHKACLFNSPPLTSGRDEWNVAHIRKSHCVGP